MSSVEAMVRSVRREAEQVLGREDVRFERGVQRPLGRKGRETRGSILRAAADTVTEVGWAGTSIAGIAERAGVGVGTVYQYFRSKEDVVGALVAEWTLKALDDVRRWDPHDGLDGLADLIRRFVTMYATTAGFQRVWEELSIAEPSLAALRADLTEVFVKVFADAFATAASLGLIDPGPRPLETSRAVNAMIERYCLQVFVRNPRSTTPRQAADLLTRLSLSALKAGAG